MADISQYLQAIMSAVYGEDVRSSIHDAIAIINDVSEVVLSTGTAITGPTSSSAGFYQDSLYLNTNTFELWKCTGQDSWASQGVVKGDTGNGIASIEKTSTSGLVDTYTITYTDGNTTTFDITNGEDGEDGNRWFRGTAISGKAVNPTVYPSTGITYANPNDFYLNPTEGAVYHCVNGGAANIATWSYDFTMAGGGGSVANLNDLEDVTIASPSSGEALVYNGSSSKWENGRAYELPTASTTTKGGVKVDGTSITISNEVISTTGYSTNDTTDTTIVNEDYVPFYDFSATSKKKITWANIKTVLANAFARLTAVTATSFAISTSGWTADSTSQSGVTLYKKSVSLNHIYKNCPDISIGAVAGLPSTAEQEAYDLLKYVTVDDTVPCLYLYASAIPTNGFYINAEGVD